MSKKQNKSRFDYVNYYFGLQLALIKMSILIIIIILFSYLFRFGTQLFFTSIFICIAVVLAIYIYVKKIKVINYVNTIISGEFFYKKQLYAGYIQGIEVGSKDRKSSVEKDSDNFSNSYLKATPWEIYKIETKKIESQIVKEKDEYMSQFPREQQGEKLAEIELKNIKMPSEKLYSNRYKKRVDFYVDYVNKKVKKKEYTSKLEYIKALRDEAWKLGFEYGYAEGRAYRHPSKEL